MDGRKDERTNEMRRESERDVALQGMQTTRSDVSRQDGKPAGPSHSSTILKPHLSFVHGHVARGLQAMKGSSKGELVGSRQVRRPTENAKKRLLPEDRRRDEATIPNIQSDRC